MMRSEIPQPPARLSTNGETVTNFPADDAHAKGRDIIPRLPDAVIGTDKQGRIILWNSAAERLLGYAASDIIGHSLTAIFPPAGLRDERRGTFEGSGIRRDGTELHLEISLAHCGKAERYHQIAVIRDSAAWPRATRDPRAGEHWFRFFPKGLVDYAIVMLDPNGTVTNWNAGAGHIKGYLTDEVIGQHFSCLFTEDDRAAGIPANVMATAKREGKYEAESWRVRRDGSRFCAEVVINVICDDAGQNLGFAEITHDLTQQRLAQDVLSASERRFKAFAEMAADWFWEQDAQLRFVFQASIPGTSLPADVGKTRWELADPDMDPHRWDAHKADLAARRSFRDFRWERIRLDGTRGYFSTSGDPIFDAAGNFVGYHGTGRDVTAEVEAAEQLRLAKEQAESAFRAKSEFLANMSHELRTPLHSIIGFGELIRDQAAGRINPQYSDWARDILQCGGDLLHAINSVLELARIDAGRYPPTNDRVSLSTAIRTCIAKLRPVAAANHVKIDCLSDHTDVDLLAAHQAVNQIVLSLLTNAVKFTPAHGSVSIGIENMSDGSAALIVRDTGIGIDPESVARLGQPFTWADGSLRRKHGGVGLGLAIASKLVTLHGGTLSINSEQGRGTTVRVTFPADRVILVGPRTSALTAQLNG